MNKTLLYGDEPYLMDEYRKKILSSNGETSYEIKSSYDFSTPEYDFITMSSFFSEEKILFLHLEKLDINKDLQEAIKMDPDGVCLYVIWHGQIVKNKKNDKIMGLFDEKVLFNKVSNTELHERIIVHIENHCSSKISKDGFQLLCRKLNYSSDNVNLYSVYNTLNVICYMDEPLTAELIEEMVSDNIEEKSSKMITFIRQKNYADLFRYCRMLVQNRDSGAIIGVLSYLCVPFRSNVLFLQTASGTKNNGFNIPPYIAQRCFSFLIEGIKNIKSGSDAGEELKMCLVNICFAIHGKTGKN